ncbi:MAG: M23 family metallopeptidase [candidate division Zixibacteria bacterium]|nr:M23 family metallopeptidase [candidate division Zixibacteria bacterium]
MRESRYVTLMLVPDGTESRRGWRVRRWVLNLIMVAFAVTVIGIVMFFTFYGLILSRAARTEQLTEENERLRRYRYKVQLLENNMEQVRGVVTRLTQLAGIEYQFPELPDDSTLMAVELDSLGEAAPVTYTRSGKGSNPIGTPVKGVILKLFGVDTLSGTFHTGVDFACANGSAVLATGSGLVEFADFDSTMGYLAVIRHNDSISTLYGHNDSLLVRAGDRVIVGQQIALSGNSGISSTAHLHYEVRLFEQPINPLDNLYAKETF